MRNLCALAIAVVCSLSLVQAKPYYFYYADPVADEPAKKSDGPQAVQTLARAAEGAKEQVQSAATAASDKIQQQQQSQQQSGEGEQLPKRIQGHLSELYSHGSSAVRGVVDKMQPDIKNIGKDLSEVYQATRSEVGKRIEPIAHTVRPYIDQAQKVMAPYVSQAREEVPKLINQAGPALSKVGEQVRGGINGVWTKINGGGSGGSGSEMAQDAQSQIQTAAEQAKNHAANAVQKAPEASQTLAAAANPK